MNISMMQQSLNSVRQAIGIANMSRAMNQNASTVSKLMQGMEESAAKINADKLERSINPHLGGNIDISA